MSAAPTRLRVGSLFSGYGGLDVAVAEVLDAETVWVSDISEGARAILAHHWPDVPNLGDITQVDWASVPPVEVLTGGFPCQDLSIAGPRAGLAAGARSGLWSHMHLAIDQLRPSLVLIENVRGLLSAEGEPITPEIAAMEARTTNLSNAVALVDRKLARAVREGNTRHAAFHRRDAVRLARLHHRQVARTRRARARLVRALGAVLRDLADIGYHAAWHGLRAADVGAPHARYRIFILAWPATHTQGDPRWLDHRDDGDAAHPDSPRREAHERLSGATEVPGTGRRPSSDLLPTPIASDARGVGAHGTGGLDLRTTIDLLATPTAQIARNGGAQHPSLRKAGGHTPTLADQIEHLLPTPVTQPDTGNGPARHLSAELLPTPTAMDSRASGGAEGSSNVTLTDAMVRGRGLLPTPRASDGTKGGPHQRGSSGDLMLPSAVQNFGPYAPAIARWEAVLGRVAPSPTEPTGRGGAHRLAPAFVEWMQGLPAGHVTDPDIWVGWGDSGARNAQLEALGNGVVPQQAATALRWLLVVRAQAVSGVVAA